MVTPARPIQRLRRKRFMALVMAMLGLVTVAFAGAVYVDYNRTLSYRQAALSSYALLLDRSVASSLTIANLQMEPVLRHLGHALPFSDNPGQEMAPTLLRALESINQIDALLLIDADGLVIWASTTQLLGVDVSDRAYFGLAQTADAGDFILSDPVLSRATNRRVVPIAWPVRAADGTLIGVVASSLGDAYFERLISTADAIGGVGVTVETVSGAIAFTTAQGQADRALVARLPPSVAHLGVSVSSPLALALSDFTRRTLISAVLAAFLCTAIVWAAFTVRRRTGELAGSLARLERDRLQIEKGQQELEAIFQNVHDGIVVLADDPALENANPRALDMLGVSTSKQAAARLRDLLADSLPDLGTTGATDTEIELQPADGSDTRFLRLSIARADTVSPGGDRAYIVLSDMTEQRRLSAAREGFIATVNHELRTPLTSLKGSLQVLSGRYRAELSDSAAKLLGLATSNADRLHMLINDVLTLQAIDQKGLSIRPETTPVSEVLEEAQNANQGYATSRNVVLAFGPAPSDVAIHIDPARMQQVLANVLSNAIKYSAVAGAVSISTNVQAGNVIITISDQGPGIPDSALPRIFERFGAPVHDAKTQVEGTGLGLSITRDLVTRMGGTIIIGPADSARTPPGTLVTLSFPSAPPKEVSDEHSDR